MGRRNKFFIGHNFPVRTGFPFCAYIFAFYLSDVTFKLFLQNCGIEMRGCWKGPISPLRAARGNSGRRVFLECVVRVVEPSGSPTMVPCFSFLESVPGVCGVKNFMVAPDSKRPKTIFEHLIVTMKPPI